MLFHPDPPRTAATADDVGRFAAWMLLAASLLLCGCAAPGTLMLHGVGRAAPGTPPTVVDATPEQARQGVRIHRDGRLLDTRVGMPLAEGDRIESLPDSIAIIRFPDGHEAILLPGTRVRLGSLFTEIGEVFVRVFERTKDQFKVKTRYVTAGVEGTSFWVRLDAAGRLTVGVTEGRITLSSEGGRWQPVPVLADEVAVMLKDGPPTKAQLERAQLDGIVRQVGRLRLTPPPPRLGR